MNLKLYELKSKFLKRIFLYKCSSVQVFILYSIMETIFSKIQFSYWMAIALTIKDLTNIINKN